MGKYKAKTTKTGKSVPAFIKSLPKKEQQDDVKKLVTLFRKASGFPPKMWGPSIIGFGEYSYTYDSGHSGTTLRVGFSPRKGSISLYLLPYIKVHEKSLKKLGPHKTGVACVYIKSLEDIDQNVLSRMIKDSLKELKKLYG